jgi:hypothetical protein
LEFAQRESVSESVVISQTCDVVLPKRPTVVIAEIVELEEKDARRAKAGHNPRYVRVEGMRFADLSRITSLEKSELIEISSRESADLASERDKRDFGIAIGRWFGRFAFPDDVVPWLSPLEEQIREKYEKPESPLGKVLQDVVEIRVEATDWLATPLTLTLHVIARAGSVPDPDGLDEPTKALVGRLRKPSGEPKSPSDVASVLNSATDDTTRSYCWDVLVESLAMLCVPKASKSSPSVAGAVADVDGLLWTDDQFPLARVHRSEILDVDYLSSPQPFSEI